jgi:hypothetical protein
VWVILNLQAGLVVLVVTEKVVAVVPVDLVVLEVMVALQQELLEMAEQAVDLVQL